METLAKNVLHAWLSSECVSDLMLIIITQILFNSDING